MPSGINGVWSVVLSGTMMPICSFQTFIGFKFKGRTDIPHLPMEKGQFSTINKWLEPYEAEVTLAQSGEAVDIESMLLKLEYLKNSTQLVDIVTPFFTFSYGNIQDIEYGFSQEETGASMAVVTMEIKEIRDAATAERFQEITDAGAKTPDVVSTVDMGNVQGDGTLQSFPLAAAMSERISA